MLPISHTYSKAFRQHWEYSLLKAHLPITHRENVYGLLSQAYSESQRYYHTQQHIVECLVHFQEVKHLLCDPLAVETSIWFHDVIYDPHASDNELQSAELMKYVCQNFLLQAQLEKIYEWILATQKHQACEATDLHYLLDIDLAILGSDSNRFAEYESQIRHEYAWVEPNIYQVKRWEILNSFYQMNPIYQTPFFHSRYDKKAKLNLKNHAN